MGLKEDANAYKNMWLAELKKRQELEDKIKDIWYFFKSMAGEED